MTTKKICADKECDSAAEGSGAIEHQRLGAKSTEVGALAGTVACKKDLAEQQPQSEPADIKLDYLTLRQLASPVSGELTDENAIDGAIKRYLAFEPTDAIEATLALFLTGLTNAAMDGLGRASRAGLVPEVRQAELKLSYMGTAVSLDVLKALQAHRRPTDQKVNVANVNVAKGGRAIVGHVQAPRREDKGEKDEE
jgi:hypothetical protein